MSRATLLFLSLCPATSSAADWPEFRGPTGQGLAQEGGLPIEWGPSKNVAWRKAIPGSGWSSPVVVAGKVYLTAAVPVPNREDLALSALCLDAKDGKILWNVEVFRQGADAPGIHDKNSHASPTPVVKGDRLFVHFGHMGTACLDLKGKVLWRNRDLEFVPVHGAGGSPIVVDDLLVFSGDGFRVRFVVALETATGKVRWQTERSGPAPVKQFSFTTPLLINHQGRRQIISPGSDVVGAYDPSTGKELWRVRYRGYSVIPRPVYGHGLLFVCTGYESPRLLAIRPDGKGDVTNTHVKWTTGRGVPHAPSPLLVGSELYMVSDRGVASCLDAKTGKVHWSQRLGTAFSASPLHAAGRIYFQAEDGKGVVLKAGTTFARLARNDLGERSLASYASADGALFIRTAGHLYRVQGK
jgi:outer membrane protein assembly factor BamB